MAATIGEFLERLEASGILDKGALAAVREKAGNPAEDAGAFVKQLHRDGDLTAYQAKVLWKDQGHRLSLGNYVVEDELGRGGMGVVLKAHHRRMQRYAAIKVLPAAMTKDEDAIARFQREVVAAAQLSHPNIVGAYEADEFDGRHVLVLEFVDGRDLSSVVKKNGPLSVEQAIDCVTQAAKGLEYAHGKGVVHRDIKPANLLLDNEGTVKILDMGLARFSESAEVGTQAELTGTGTIMGTVDYMSPEQALSTRSADERSDVYSLGITLWYLLTGKPAYGGDSLMARMLAHERNPIPSLVAFRNDVPQALQSVFERMVAKDPADRPQTMSEVVTALEGCHGDASATVVTARAGDSGSGQNLSGFLNSLDAEGVSDTVSGTAAVAVTDSGQHGGSAPEITQTVHGLSEDGTVRTLASGTQPITVQLPPWATDWRTLAAAAGGFVLLIALMFTAFRAPNEGTLRIEIADPLIKVRVKGTEIVVSGENADVPLEPGEYVLTVIDGALTFDTEPVTIGRGQTVALRAEAVEGVLRAIHDGDVIGSAMPIEPKTDPSSPQFALEFDGVDDYVIVPTLNLEEGEYTIEAWCEPSRGRVSHEQVIVETGRRNPQGMRTKLTIPVTSATSPSSGFQHVRNEADSVSSITTKSNPSGLVQLAAVWNGETNTLVVNGRAYKSNSRAGSGGYSVSSMPDTRIGARHRSGETGSQFAGRIAGVRVLRRARYDGFFHPPSEWQPDEDTIALYRFDEGDGDVLTDSSGNGHHGKIVGAKWVRVDAGSTRPSPGLSFAGGGARVEVDGFPFPADMPVTMEAWVTPERDESGSILDWYGDARLQLAMGGSGPYCYHYGDLFTGAFVRDKATHAVLVGRTHIATTWDGTEIHLFMNGRNVGRLSRKPSDRSYSTDGITFYIGGRPLQPDEDATKTRPWSSFPGVIHGARVSRGVRYGKEFDPQDVLDNDEHTLALYHFDEGSGDVLKDSSGNGHHGKIVGAKWVRLDGAEPITPATTEAPPPAVAPFDAAAAKAHQEAWAKHLGVPVEYENSLRMKFRLVPPGRFTMGGTREEIEYALTLIGGDPFWTKRLNSEEPRHEVILTKPVYVGVTEVTQSQYERVMGTNPSMFSSNGDAQSAVAGMETGSHPVENVGWFDAAEFCTKLSRMEHREPFYSRDGETVTMLTGTGYRLPTEAEWEWSCRAGTTTKFWTGDTEKDLASAAWTKTNSGGRTHAVGELRPNPFGLFDVHGNVWEWVQDRWSPAEFYNQFADRVAVDPFRSFEFGDDHVLRGGNWKHTTPFCRSATRLSDSPKTTVHFGFRVVLAVEGVRADRHIRGVPAADSDAPPPAVAPFDEPRAKLHQAAWAKHLGEPVVTTNSIGMQLAVIPPGEFKMGEGENAVDVTLTKPFRFGVHEVTQGQWKAVMGTEPWKGQENTIEGDNVPATFVSWTDAVAFCRKLTERERAAGRLRDGWEYRLPTEAEWEYACRAGATTGYTFGFDESQLGGYAWYDENTKNVSEPHAHPSGLKQPSSWGLYDIHGNTWEWCSDWRGDTLPGGTDPTGPTGGSLRVRRGGSWLSPAGSCRLPYRLGHFQSFRGLDVGFRLALSQTASPPPAVAPFDAAAARAHQAAWAKHLGEPVVTTNSIGMQLAVIPPGKFKMGEPKKAVDVTLTKPLRFGVHEVTQGQWKAVMETEPWKGQENVELGDDVAASYTSWNGAVDFCRRLTERERDSGKLPNDRVYRLPTEAEWEWACRAGSKTRFFHGDDPSQLGDYAWYFPNAEDAGEAYPHPVGLKKPNPWGLYDVHGNVWEWCRDPQPAGTRPLQPAVGSLRYFRGGSWDGREVHAESSYRWRDDPSTGGDSVGFRVVMSPTGE